jgi:hypothetical protein
MATATPKLDLLAQRFMAQIQDPVTVNGLGNLNVGNLVRTIPDMSRYCGDAMLKYIQKTWDSVNGNEQMFLRKLPELFTVKSLTFPLHTNQVDLSNSANGNFFDVQNILDSYQGSTFIEVWDQDKLSGALSGSNPFHIGSSTRPGIIYEKPNLYLFPASLTASALYTISLCYIRLPIDPVAGGYLQIDGTLGDIPFTLQHIQEIADVAQSLYVTDDMETSS